MTNCQIICGDALTELRKLPDGAAQMCVTSPPYWSLRDYKANGQIGLEKTPEEYVAKLVEIFHEVRRIIQPKGTLWLNLGDAYASDGGPGWQGKNGDRSARKFTGTRNTVGMRECTKTCPRGIKPKDLIGLPWMVAFALRADGWYLRSEIIWNKPNVMPESVRDRPTKTHEKIFLFGASSTYYYDADSIKEPASEDTHARYARGRRDDHKWADGGPTGQTIATNKPGSRFASGVNPKCDEPDGFIKQNSSFSAAVKDLVEFRNKRDVWTVPTQPYHDSHFATYPEALITPCILAGSRPGETVLDCFGGSGTSGQVAQKLGRNAILIEINPSYVEMIRRRTAQTGMILA